MDHRVIAFDTETYRILPGRTAPPMVCLSWAEDDRSGLVDRADGLRLVKQWLADDRIMLVNQNIAFDLAVIAAHDPEEFLPLIFDAYDADRIACVGVYQKMRDIAEGQMSDKSRYSLEATVHRLFGADIEGKHGADVWRLRYRELEGVAIRDWPQEARRYAIDDARWALRAFREQCAQGRLPDLERQMRADWVLQLIRAWGIRTDEESIDILENRLSTHVGPNLQRLVDVGIYRNGGTRAAPKLVKTEAEVRRRVFAELGQVSPLTEGGEKRVEARGYITEDDVSIATETLELCQDPGLLLLAEISGDQKLLNTYIPLLRQGQDKPLCPFWNVLVRSGRTSCGEPNLQNQPRAPGVRECFIPRPGWVFGSTDYHTAEVRSLAQVLLDEFGESEMASVLRAGRDIHLVTGASILGISYDQIVAWYKGPHASGCTPGVCTSGCLKKKAVDARQLSKAANFGLSGGLGAAAFVRYAAGPDYRIVLTLERSQEIKEAWLSSYPEMRRYFSTISFLCNRGGGRFELTQPRSGRIRGDCGYTDGANTKFQGLTADGMKEAAYQVIKEMYDPRHRASPLYGTRANALIHDEIFMEAPETRAAEALERCAVVMVEAMQRWLPDIPVSADPALMRRWSKAAGNPVRDAGGRLIPYEDSLRPPAEGRRHAA